MNGIVTRSTLAGLAATIALGALTAPSKLLGEIAPADSAVRPGPPRIVADIANKQIFLQYGDSVVTSYDIAVGTARYPTPTGSFRVRKLTWNPRWVPPDSKWARNKTAKPPGHPENPMKVVKIFFKEPDYYIHGTGDVESLGSAASHGCVRMDPDDVTEVGRWIMANGGAPREENWFLRILHSRREEKVVFLSSPIAMEVVN